VFFFLAKWCKISPFHGEPHTSQKESPTPIHKLCLGCKVTSNCQESLIRFSMLTVVFSLSFFNVLIVFSKFVNIRS
jgi:hypothetical protein